MLIVLMQGVGMLNVFSKLSMTMQDVMVGCGLLNTSGLPMVHFHGNETILTLQSSLRTAV